MELVEYEDCISAKFSHLSDDEVEEQGSVFTVDLQIINGVETEVEVVARPKGNETFEVLEVRMDNSLDREDLTNIADLRWHVFTCFRQDLKLAPLVASWEDEVIVAACQTEKYGGALQTFRQQMNDIEDEDTLPDPDRLLCWWPEKPTWTAMRKIVADLRRYNTQTFTYPFYTLGEWYARPDLAGTDYGVRAVEYARHLRQIRTMLLWHRQREQSAQITVGSVQKAEHLFREMGLDPDDPGSWSAVVTGFEPMPDVFLETSRPCGPTGVVSKASDVTAVINVLSHLPGLAPSVDCIGAAIYAGRTNISNLFAWCNPLAGSGAYEKAMDVLMAQFDKYGVNETLMMEGMLPFEVCPDCGAMTLRVPDDFNRAGTPVRVGPKPGRNDPCPCGSGKKYKRCCGR
ncbi:MAG TPA: SEC-C metal-binding domain-containing protein [Spirochaetia bacterium]|nr:SEC-C metal-binding domain-containing protein [Spirochaetia bacterium]